MASNTVVNTIERAGSTLWQSLAGGGTGLALAAALHLPVWAQLGTSVAVATLASVLKSLGVSAAAASTAATAVVSELEGAPTKLP
jgi:hypothetical protein